MLKELYRGVAIQVLDLAAAQTLFVEVIAAIAVGSHVLVQSASVLLPVELAQRVVLAKGGQLAVDAAFFAAVLPVKSKAELLGTELLIGVRGQKAQ